MTDKKTRNLRRSFRKSSDDKPKINILLRPYVGSEYQSGLGKSVMVYGTIEETPEELREEVWNIIIEALSKAYGPMDDG